MMEKPKIGVRYERFVEKSQRIPGTNSAIDIRLASKAESSSLRELQNVEDRSVVIM